MQVVYHWDASPYHWDAGLHHWNAGQRHRDAVVYHRDAGLYPWAAGARHQSRSSLRCGAVPPRRGGGLWDPRPHQWHARPHQWHAAPHQWDAVEDDRRRRRAHWDSVGDHRTPCGTAGTPGPPTGIRWGTTATAGLYRGDRGAVPLAVFAWPSRAAALQERGRAPARSADALPDRSPTRSVIRPGRRWPGRRLRRRRRPMRGCRWCRPCRAVGPRRPRRGRRRCSRRPGCRRRAAAGPTGS